MNYYRIEVKETVIATYEVRADNEDDAVDYILSNVDLLPIDEYAIEQDVLEVENLGERIW